MSDDQVIEAAPPRQPRTRRPPGFPSWEAWGEAGYPELPEVPGDPEEGQLPELPEPAAPGQRARSCGDPRPGFRLIPGEAWPAERAVPKKGRSPKHA
jgi:hypothetical protein